MAVLYAVPAREHRADCPAVKRFDIVDRLPPEALASWLGEPNPGSLRPNAVADRVAVQDVPFFIGKPYADG